MRTSSTRLTEGNEQLLQRNVAEQARTLATEKTEKERVRQAEPTSVDFLGVALPTSQLSA